MHDMKELGDAVIAAVKSFVQKAELALALRIDALEKRFSELPVPKDGIDGKDGVDGKDAEPIDKTELVKSILAELPAPVAGKDGASVTADDVTPLIDGLVAKAVDGLPKPKDGESVDPEAVKAMVADAVAEIPKPVDGKSITPDDVAPMLADLVGKAVAAIPDPKDGKSVPVEEVRSMIDAAVSKAVSAITIPSDGAPGRDAAHLEILPAIDAEKTYPRGSYAKHAGGLWRSFEATAGMRGWECIVEGVASQEVKQLDARSFEIVSTLSSGAAVKSALSIPSMIYRGVFREGDDYTQGDTTTWAGSLWHCEDATKEKPIDGSKCWKLVAKRGRDGKDGIDGKDFTRGVSIK